MKLATNRIHPLKHRNRSTPHNLSAKTGTPIDKESSAQAEPTTQPKLQHVVMHRTFPNAKTVCIAGSFNRWEPAATEMVNFGSDRWRLDLMLKPGKYEYRFVVDGNWSDDPVTHNQIPNPFGGHNSVLLVSDHDQSKTAKAPLASGLN